MTKTKAGTRKIELTEEALAALISQKMFTFMKDETIFEDPKSNKAWTSADAIRKKHGSPHYVKPGLDTVTHSRLGTPLLLVILAEAQTSSG